MQLGSYVDGFQMGGTNCFQRTQLRGSSRADFHLDGEETFGVSLLSLIKGEWCDAPLSRFYKQLHCYDDEFDPFVCHLEEGGDTMFKGLIVVRNFEIASFVVKLTHRCV